MPRPGKVPLHRLTITLPEELYLDVERIVGAGKRWISEVDFIRHATSDAVDKWRSEHPASAGPLPGGPYPPTRGEKGAP